MVIVPLDKELREAAKEVLEPWHLVSFLAKTAEQGYFNRRAGIPELRLASSSFGFYKKLI